MSNENIEDVVIIGAGPAGLTAGFELLRHKDFRVILIERDHQVGGLSKTTEFKGCKFDIGPHHFITQSDQINKWWKDLMEGEEKKGNKFVLLKRFTRIYYKNHFFNYPLRPFNALFSLNIIESILCILSYIKIRLFPIKNVKTFQDEVTNKFGYRLFSIFFKTYTEKVWGIPCVEISADWAKERIKGFSLSKAIFNAFFGRWLKRNTPRTLSNVFHYPEQGAGSLWNKVAKRIKNNKGDIVLNEKIVEIKHEGNKITAVLSCNVSSLSNTTHKLYEYKADHFLSTMPLKDFILALNPMPPKKVIAAARLLVYRGLVTINFIINKKDVCPDHWLYIHEKKILMGRIGNMKNFSVKMSNNKRHTSLSLEYFTFVGSNFWKKSDEELLDLGRTELQKVGLAKKTQIADGMILKEPQAYPVYNKNYKENLKIILEYLSKFNNLSLMGRNGLHKYNNMDIAMLSAFKVVGELLKHKKLLRNNINSIKNLNKSNKFQRDVSF